MDTNPNNKNQPPPQTQSSSSSLDSGTIAIIIYFGISFVTFILYIWCGAKSRNVGQVFVGVFLSSMWPLLLIYVIIKKFTDKDYKFCRESGGYIRHSPAKSLSRR